MHNLIVRKDYEFIPVEQWTYEELIGWLYDYGAYSCGMDTCTPEELLEEVILQAEAVDFELCRDV